jgi:hypothetical protein
MASLVPIGCLVSDSKAPGSANDSTVPGQPCSRVAAARVNLA